MLSDRALARLTILMPDAGVRLAGRSQTALYRWTAGRLGGRFGRGPVLLLTTTGRRSGKPRCTAVLCGKDGSRLVVIGSNTGSERPPAWALNLRPTPKPRCGSVAREPVSAPGRSTAASERGSGSS
jgi:F420H(2)-dependent quinone reductase